MEINVVTVVDDMSDIKIRFAEDNKRFIDQLVQVNKDFVEDARLMRDDQTKINKRMKEVESILNST